METHRRLAGAVGRQRVELAGAALGAVAQVDACTAQSPIDMGHDSILANERITPSA
jgi:hypothetical protein